MKRLAVLLSALSCCCVGCRTPYVVTLTTGTTLMSPSKPKYADGYFRWEDSYGRPMEIPAANVRVIEPKSAWEKDKNPFFAP